MRLMVAAHLAAAMVIVALVSSCAPASPAKTAASDGSFVLFVETPDGHGSGFSISASLLVTNHHVSDGEGRVVVDIAGVPRSTRVVRTSEGLDLTLLEIEAGEPPMLDYASLRCERPLAGEAVYATGHPLYARWSTYWGRVASNLPPAFPETHYEPHLVILDMGVNRGLSGSPVMDVRGLVVGVISGTLVETSRQGDGVMAQSALMIAGDALCEFLAAPEV